MSKYKSKPSVVDMAPEAVAAKFEDLSVLEGHLDNIPAEERAKIGELAFERDAIVIRNPQIGEMRFSVVERSPERIVFRAGGMLPLSLIIDLKGLDDNTRTEITTTIDIDIPVFLRPMIGGKIQQIADTFGEMMSRLANNNGF